MGTRKIDAVIFDLDGVITDTAHFHYLAWKDLADKLNIEFDQKFNENLKGVSRVQSLELILEKGNKAQNFTEEEKEKLANEKNEIYKQYISQLTPDAILPGIQPLIAKLKEEGILIGLASVSKNAQTVLKALKIEELFDYCADANKITRSKPDPEIFLNVCEALQVHPSCAIGIEDAVVGIEAIKDSDMFAVGVGKNLEYADFLVESTDQLDWGQIKTSFFNFKKS
ncbi:beta-phosphoglucomutase [Gracilibacillus sp. HCP3S3_G5_1]|uniref:beta-phosphoglucomutase n=1 Tax=unclassified Gracilibacillus TaxID=2625209 RepID=UPI003F8BA74B